MQVKINIKKTNEHATVPMYGTDGAAAADLFACIPQKWQRTTVPAGQTVVIDTGVAMAIPEGYVGLVFPRSGWATKQGLSLANCVGVIDSDYRGTIGVALHNHSDVNRIVQHGDRVAQIAIIPFMKCEFGVVDELDETERGAGGFGSTGQ